MSITVTIGFVKDAKAHIDVQGFNVYHKNRLIKVGLVCIGNLSLMILTIVVLDFIHIQQILKSYSEVFLK